MTLNKEIVCKDGFTMSVQANEFAYCSPRATGSIKYTSVEVGYPSQPEPLLVEWVEDPEKTNKYSLWVRPSTKNFTGLRQTWRNRLGRFTRRHTIY